VLDARGIIAAKYLTDDSGGRYTLDAILIHQFRWTPPEAAVEVEGKQLTAAARASDATVAPGERIALTLDLDLQPGMHVYAPGVEGYIPIDWKMQDSPAAAVHAPTFPHSEKLYLKAIGETVPAYRGHFRLTRDVTIERPPDNSGKLTVNGSLRYQACDDRVCYIPKELQLTWTFQYEAP
jgi:DsbC/DsbD-like thiol-disulfide interchange protein